MEKAYENINVFLDVELSTRNDVLEYISSKAVELNIYSNKDDLLLGFLSREKEASTGFEDGFAIPHSKVKGIQEPSIICVRLKNGVDWESLDKKPTNIAIALIIPDKANEDHINLLSSIAIKLMNKNTRESLKKATTNAKFISILCKEKDKTKERVQKLDLKGLNIVAVTACIIGVAHTYMAEERLLDSLTKAGHNIRVETQGSKGVGTPLTSSEIEKADIVILAADTNVEKSRFNGKKVYETHVSRAIKEPLKVLNDALDKGKILQDSVSFGDASSQHNEKQGVLKHILAGISYMIPIIIMGGICLAASLGIAKAIWGPTASTTGLNNEHPWNPLAIMEKIGGAAFTLMIPILAAFIANSIAGRAAIAPALVGGFIGNDAKNFMPLPGMPEASAPMGFIGAIIAGLLVGYFVRWVNTWNVPKALRAAMPIFFIPIIGGVGISILFIYIIGGPIGYVVGEFGEAIKKGYKSESFGVGLGMALGILLGAMASFDMGGPINKVAFVTCVALIDQQVYYPMGAMATAIPIAPLGMGLTSVLFKRFFSKDEQAMGASAIIMGTIGISEGAIPFAIRDPKRAIPCNILGGMVAGGIAGAFKIEDSAGHGGPIVAFLGAIPYGEQTLIYFVAVAAGVFVTSSLYGLWLVSSLGKVGSVKEAKVKRIEVLLEERKQKEYEVTRKIKNLKKLIKNANNEDEVSALKNKIEDLRSQYLPIKTEFIERKEKTNKSYLEVKNSEKSFVASNRKNIKDAKNKIIKNKKKELEKLHKAKAESFKTLDKFAKRDFNKNYFKNIEEVKNTASQELLNNLINVRKPFVSKFVKNC